jgi:cytochrome c oxidase subunit 4
MREPEEKFHMVRYSVLVKVWVCLIVLTAVNIYVAGFELGALSTLIAIFIASITAILVLMFFMHLRYEPPLFVISSVITVLTLTVIILMTFSDVWFR